jgi:hypothetical protein
MRNRQSNFFGHETVAAIGGNKRVGDARDNVKSRRVAVMMKRRPSAVVAANRPLKPSSARFC